MWVKKIREVGRYFRKFREVENDENSEGIDVWNLNSVLTLKFPKNEA